MNLLAEHIEKIDLKVGEELVLENFRITVVPPHLNLEAFIKLPENLTLLKTEIPEQEGTFESIYYLKAHSAGNGVLKIGYKDWDTNSNAREKEISVTVS